MNLNRFLLLRLWTLAFLTAVWVLLWGNVSFANILGGIAVGLGIMVLLPLPRVPVEGRIHILSLLRLIGLFTYLAAESSVNVAWLAIRPQKPPVTGVVRFRLTIKSDLVLTLFVDGLNLFPGTMVLEIDQNRRLIYVHLLDMGSQKAVDSFFHSMRRLENLFVAAFERDSDWKPSPHHAEQRYHAVEGDDVPREHVPSDGGSDDGGLNDGGPDDGVPGDAVISDEGVAKDLKAPAERRDDKKVDDERKGDWK